MTRILIPIDFSECSINALKYGLAYADKMEVEPDIIIAHGYHIPVPAAEFSISLNASVLEEFKKDAEEKYEELKSRMPELENPGIRFDIKLAFALDAILKCIQEENPELVIMGTKGASGINEVIFGSNTSGVIKESKVPVIAVPETHKESNISRITLAIDSKGLEDISILDLVMELAKQHHAPIDILHVQSGDEPDRKALDEVARFFEETEHEFHIIDQESVAEGIEEFLDSTNSDLLALIPRKHSLIERLFSKSVTTKIAHHTTIPLLAIPTN